MTELMRFANVFKVIDRDLTNDEPLIAESYRQLRPEETFMQNWANYRCAICGLLRLQHHVNWNNIHAFTRER